MASLATLTAYRQCLAEFTLSRLTTKWREQVRNRDIAAALELLEGRPEGVSGVAWANAWCLANDAVSLVIPGIKSVQQLEENVAGADVTL